MRKKLFALFTALLALTLCMALFAACGGGEEEPEEPVAFSAPSDLAVDGSGVVTWSAVDGAVSYTLRVNQTEFANAVSPFDLHVSAADALVSGGAQNSIAVRTDAAGDRPASAYSSTVPYTFYTADETAANAFSAQVAAIGSDPSANADAVAAVKEAYSALTTGAAALAEDAVEALVSLDAARFVYLVGQIGTPVTLESSTAIVAAQAYYATLLDNTADGVAAAKTTLDAADAALDEAAASIRSEFGELVDAVSIAESFRGTQIDAAETAYQTALTRYGSYTSVQQAAVEELYAALQGKKTTLDAAAAAEFAAYEDLVAAVAGEVTAADSATDLSAAITAAESAFNSMADYTKSENNVTEVDASVTAAKTTLAGWNETIAAAESAMQALFTGGSALPSYSVDMTAANAEAGYTAANTFLSTYNAYAAYVKADGTIVGLYSDLTTYIENTDEVIDGYVAALAASVDGALAAYAEEDSLSSAEKAEETYNTLSAAKALYDSYEPASLVITRYEAENDGKIESVEDAVAATEAAAVAVRSGAQVVAGEVSAETVGVATQYVQVVAAAVNFRGEAVPADSVSLAAQWNGAEVEGIVSTVGTNGAYNFKVPFTDSAAGTLTYVLTVNGNAQPQQSLTVGTPIGGNAIVPVYFGATDGVTFSFANNSTAHASTIAVYAADEIEANGTSAADLVTLYGLPLATFTLQAGTTGFTLSAVGRALLQAGYEAGETLSVRLLVCQSDENGDYTRIHGGSVTAAIEIELLEEYRYESIQQNYLTWGLGEENIEYAWEFVSQANQTYFDHAAIYVYDVTGMQDLTAESILSDGTLFATYTWNEGTYVAWADIDAAIEAALRGAGKTYDSYNFTFAFGMQAVATENAEENGYTDSVITFAGDRNDASAPIATKAYDLSSVATIPETVQVGFDGNGNIIFLRDAERGNGSILTDGGVEYVKLVLSYGESQTVTLYIFAETVGDATHAVIYAAADKSGSSLDVAAVNDSWTSVAAFEQFVQGLASDFVMEGCVLHTEVVLAEDSYYKVTEENDGISDTITYSSAAAETNVAEQA